jgi:hypothetical protein
MPPFSPPGPSGWFPGLINTTRALRLPMPLPASLRCLRSAVPRWRPSLRSLGWLDAPLPKAWTLLCRCPPGFSTAETMGPPRFLGEPFARLPSLLRPRGNLRARPLQRLDVASAQTKAFGFPDQCLSRLNRAAVALAVYASWGESPRLCHARLATGGWSPSPGRTLTCWPTMEGFRE